MKRIDAHQHFWDFSRFEYDWLQAETLAPICRNYLPADLAPHLEKQRIDQSIFVQTRHDLEETHWVLGLCEQYPFLAGVVGWVDLQSVECESQLLEFRQNPKFLGVRHITQDEPDEDFIIRPEVLCGLKVLEQHGVPFDLLFYVQHLKHAVQVAQYCPELPLVIDHLGKPHIREQKLDNWEQNFRAAAACENMHCKLSGLVTEADWEHWQPADFRSYLEIALEAFGPSRLMFGSDWPVCELAARYDEVVNLIEEFVSQLSITEQNDIWSGTAERFYRIPQQSTQVD